MIDSYLNELKGRLLVVKQHLKVGLEQTDALILDVEGFQDMVEAKRNRNAKDNP